MSAELKEDMVAVSPAVQYDQKTKELIGNRMVLAHILIGTVEELKGKNPWDVADCIEKEIHISAPAKDSSQITWIDTKDSTEGAQELQPDLSFYVRMPSGRVRVILNLEMDREESDGYAVLNRAFLYACRAVASQKTKELETDLYDDFQRVYVIWICMGTQKCYQNEFSIQDTPLLGIHSWKGSKELMHTVLIGLPYRIPEQSEEYRMHRLLCALLSETTSLEDRIQIVRSEYNIATVGTLEKEMTEMSNLSQGVLKMGLTKAMEDAIQKGREEGRTEGMALGAEQGRAEGMEKGRAEGLIEGMAKGRAEGLEQGKAEGILEGMAEGMAKGRAEGMEKGMATERKNAIRMLVSNGFDKDSILKLNYTESEYEQIVPGV